MAKDRLTLYDKYGNERDVDISTEDVTLDNEGGKTLKAKLTELDDGIGSSVKRVTFNDTPNNPDEQGNVSIEQVQADWGQVVQSRPSYIRNKPTIPSRTSQLENDSGFITAAQIPEGATLDSSMSSTSENPVQNKVIKAYVDSLIDGLVNSAPAALDTLNELAAALGNDSNFASTVTNALAGKANSADVYTKSQTYSKSEVDAAVKEAGKVKSVTINGSKKLPNEATGDVDLGTVVGPQGPKGDKGDTLLVDGEFNPVTMIINGLDESDGTVALSARQGKILKGNVDALWAKVNALINDLAAMAFTGTKTQGLGNIDWTGGTFYATINKTLTGCTATDNTTNGQIAEGSTYIAYLTLPANYVIKTISVTNGKGQAVTYSLDGNTLTIANVVGTINISILAEEHIVRSVTNRLLNMTSSNSDTSIEQGESYSTQLAADNGCTANGDVRVKIGNSYAFNEYDVSHGNTNASGITYENGLLTIPAAAITGDIEIIATAYTGVVKITTTGATTLKYNGGTTFDLVEGLNEVAFPGGDSWFNVVDKTLVTSIDFGGIKFTGTYMRTLKDFTNLASVQNLVVGGGVDSIYEWFKNTSSLSAVDISLWDVSKVTTIAGLFTGSAIQRVDMSVLVFDNAISLSSTFQNTTSLTYIDIRSIENVSDVNRMFNQGGGTNPQCDVYIGDFNASSISVATNVFLNGNVNLHCLSSTPPLIGNTNWLTSGSGLAHIYVPDEAAVTAYSGATGWSAKASIIAVEPTNN